MLPKDPVSFLIYPHKKPYFNDKVWTYYRILVSKRVKSRQSSLKLNAFSILRVHRKPQICPITDIGQLFNYTVNKRFNCFMHDADVFKSNEFSHVDVQWDVTA